MKQGKLDVIKQEVARANIDILGISELKCMRVDKFNSVQALSHIQLFVTPWSAACQASLSITNFWSLLKFMSIKLVMPFNHFILCHPLLLLPSIFPSIKVFSSDSVLCISGQTIGASNTIHKNKLRME